MTSFEEFFGSFEDNDFPINREINTKETKGEKSEEKRETSIKEKIPDVQREELKIAKNKQPDRKCQRCEIEFSKSDGYYCMDMSFCSLECLNIICDPVKEKQSREDYDRFNNKKGYSNRFGGTVC